MDVWSDCTDSELLAAEKMDFVEMKDGTQKKLLAGEEMEWDDISDEDLIIMCQHSNGKCDESVDDQKTHSQLMDILEKEK